MELRHLRYFVAIVEVGSFTLAAERLHTAQPSLSRQIQDLERHVGTALLKRTSRQLELTPAGTAFLDEARLALAQVDRAVDRARQVARAGGGSLTLGFLPGVEIELLVRVMTAMRDELQSSVLTMRSLSSPELITALHRQQIDAAFVRPDDESQGLILRVVRSEGLIAALPSTHRLADAKSVDIDDLNGEPFVCVDLKHAPVLHRAVEEYVASRGMTPHRTYEAETLPMIFSLISSVGGVSLLPEYTRRLFPPTVVAVPLAIDSPTIDLALAYHPDNHSPLLKSFLAYF